MSRFARQKVAEQEAVVAQPPAAANVAPSRQGKKALTVYVSKDMARAIQIAAIDGETSVQALMVEALADWLAKDAKRK
jgi:predicted HicB family RNase H-like nuclease